MLIPSPQGTLSTKHNPVQRGLTFSSECEQSVCFDDFPNGHLRPIATPRPRNQQDVAQARQRMCPGWGLSQANPLLAQSFRDGKAAEERGPGALGDQFLELTASEQGRTVQLPTCTDMLVYVCVHCPSMKGFKGPNIKPGMVI